MIAIATCAERADLPFPEQALLPMLAAMGLEAVPVIWNDPQADWSRFDAVVLRSVWDYHLHGEAFNAWLDTLERLSIPTLNPVGTIRGNMHKFYLQGLAEAGIPIIPTVFLPRVANKQDFTLRTALQKGWPKMVIKPALSAGAYLTEIFEAEQIQEVEARYADLALEREFLVQPFLQEIQTEGEWSLLYFHKKFSHAVLKCPKPGDFRVQSQFGGQYSAQEPSEHLLQSAQNILDLLPDPLLFARIDGVIVEGQFLVMEVELIEPDLFLDYHPDAKSRLTQAIATELQQAAPAFFAHPSAVLDPGCQIGSGSKIWHFSHLMPTCKLGHDCIIGQNVFIANGVTLGNGVKVQNNVSLFTGVTCEDAVFIGPSVVFTNVLNPRSFVERKTEFRPTTVRHGASIGANATILCGIEIGAFALIGAGAVVTKDVPAHALVVGNPARIQGWVSKNGHRLSFDAHGVAFCPETGEKHEKK